MRSRIIGGEFELTDLPKADGKIPDCYAYASGRAALYQILTSLKFTHSKVWLPDWLCESMIDAVRRAGIEYSFYPLGLDLQINIDKFVESNSAIQESDIIVLVNYFGLLDVDTMILELRQAGVWSVIIEDDVQALFSFFDGKLHYADFRFTSLRKSIPAPDGGLVNTLHLMPKTYQENTFSEFKLNGALIKGNADIATKDEDYLDLFEQGEKMIEQNYESRMSEASYRILADTDLLSAAEKRKSNARFLIDALHNLGIEPMLPLTDDCVPLFVPIEIERRDDIRRALRENGIFCPVHWPLRKDMLKLSKGREMAERELSLVIDQRYSYEDMSSIAEVIKESLCR